MTVRFGRCWGVLLAAATLCALALVPASARADGGFGPGRYLRSSLVSDGSRYSYTVYVPASYRPAAAAPLLVMIHGCNSDADDLAAASGYNEMAEEHGFVVLYPDMTASNQLFGRCWKGAYAPAGETRGSGDGAAIVAMTRVPVADVMIDRSRVYAMGMSSGAFESSILGGEYPDVFAAIGVSSGAAFMRGVLGCGVVYAPVADTGALAWQAYAAMGPRARVMPVIVFHGRSDPLIPYPCGEQALAQWLQTDNLVRAQQSLPPLPTEPTSTVRTGVPGAHAHTVDSYAGEDECTVAQLWSVDGMGHYFSGGSPAPESAEYTDPRGPSAARASWAFFSQFALGGGTRVCATRPAAARGHARLKLQIIARRRLRTGHSTRIVVAIRNVGSAPAGRLVARIRIGSGLRASRTKFTIRSLANGRRRRITTRIRATGTARRTRIAVRVGGAAKAYKTRPIAIFE